MRYPRALALLAGVAALVGYSSTARSSDHGDSPAVQMDPTADIDDVYAWMGDASHVVLAMTLDSNAGGNPMFSDAVDYVFHTASATKFSPTIPTTGTDIIATFDANQKISLWVGTSEFVTGDASSTAGLASADGKVKVFAGQRADPFFFNFAGFGNAVTAVDNAAPSLTFTDAGCPNVNAATSNTLATLLRTSTVDGGAPTNPFSTWNALAIVVSVDKSLLTTPAQSLVSVWAGTYHAQ